MRTGASETEWPAPVTVTVAGEDGCDLLLFLDEMLPGRNIIS